MTARLRWLASASSSRTRNFPQWITLAGLALAAGACAIPATGFSQQISGIKVEPESALAGEPVKITVTFDGDGAVNCGIAVLYSDGVMQDYKITSRAQVPLVITRTFSTPGRTVATVEPKNQGLLARCGGRSKTTAFMVAAPVTATVAAAPPRQESVAAAAAPAQSGQASAVPAAAEGDFVDNQRTGRGVKVWPNGNRYEGDWVNGEPNGNGTMVYASGQRYDGDWAYGSRTGKGVYTWPDGTRYEGDFSSNQRTGRGTSAFATGHRYEGDFINGRLTGKGTYIFPGGNRYQGDFVEGKSQGKGTFTWADGQQFDGDWHDGARTSGTYTWPNGDRYTGDFNEGKLNTGTLTRANGTRQQYTGGTVVQQSAPPAAAAPAAASRASSEPRERDDSNAIGVLSGILGGIAASRQPAARTNAPASSAASAAAIAQAAAPSTNYYQQPERYSGPGDARRPVASAGATNSASEGSGDMTTKLNASHCVTAGAIRSHTGQPQMTLSNNCGFKVEVTFCLDNVGESRWDCRDGFNYARSLEAGDTKVVFSANSHNTRWSSVQFFACQQYFNGRMYTTHNARPNPAKGQCVGL